MAILLQYQTYPSSDLTFLQICQRVRMEAGVSGQGPTSVINQTGEYKRIVNWVQTAWQDIQLARPDWYWMRSTFQFDMTIGQSEYAPVEAGILYRFSMWDTNSVSVYDTTTVNEVATPYLPYEDFRATFMRGSQITTRPSAITVTPASKLAFGSAPDKAYTARGDYFKAPQELQFDADLPEMPGQFHMAIVYRALMLYARYESAGEIFADAEQNYKRLMKRIELNQMPDATIAEPLV